MAQTYEGGCHCGAVRFRVTADLSRVTDCNCSICAKKGFLHLIVPRDAFDLLSGKDALTTYRFNNHTVRTEQWRYIRYHDGGEELYDEVKDPLEYANVAGKTEFVDIKAELAKWMPKTNAKDIGGKGGAEEGEPPNPKKEANKAAKKAAK